MSKITPWLIDDIWGVVLSNINDYISFCACRKVCKLFLRFLPISQRERCLIWRCGIECYDEFSKIPAGNCYIAQVFRNNTFIKHGYDTIWDKDSIFQIEKYQNNIKYFDAQIESPRSFSLRIFNQEKAHIFYRFNDNFIIYSKLTHLSQFETRKTWNNDVLVRHTDYVYVSPDSSKLSRIIIWLPTLVWIDYFGEKTIITVFHKNGKVRSTTEYLKEKRHNYRWVYNCRGGLLHHTKYNNGIVENFKQYHTSK